MLADGRTGARMKNGIWIGDAAKEAPIGTALQVAFVGFPPLIKRGSVMLGLEWEHFGSALLAVGFYDGEMLAFQGSAVLISSGLALGAAHVFAHLKDDLLAGRVSPAAISITPEGMVLWKVVEIVIGDTDVAIIRLNLASEFPSDGLQCASLCARLPVLGESIMVVGMRSTDRKPIGESLGFSVRIGVGEVSKVYPRQRDRTMLPSPCFEVRCLALGGMSGGPAFDQNGNLVGIISTSVESDNEGEEGPCFVSHWWPIAADAIGSIWPPGLVQELPTTILDLGKAGMVMIDEVDSIKLGKSAEGAGYIQHTGSR